MLCKHFYNDRCNVRNTIVAVHRGTQYARVAQQGEHSNIGSVPKGMDFFDALACALIQHVHWCIQKAKNEALNASQDQRQTFDVQKHASKSL